MEYTARSSRNPIYYEREERANSTPSPRQRKTTATNHDQSKLDKDQGSLPTFYDFIFIASAIIMAITLFLFLIAAPVHCGVTISIMPTTDGQFDLSVDRANAVKNLKIISKGLPRNDSLSSATSLNLTMQVENRTMFIQLQMSTETSANKTSCCRTKEWRKGERT
mgnify:CR=1 FL=1